MKGLLADVRHAFRLYRATPGSSLIAVVALAVGLAFVSAFVSLYVDLVLRAHPGIEDSGGLVTMGQTDGEFFNGLPYSLIERAADEMTSLDALAGVITSQQQIEDSAEPIRVEIVTPAFFEGIRPVLGSGRPFDADDHEQEAEPVAVISYRYWQDVLGGRPDVLGTTIEIDLQPMFFMIGPDGQPQEPEADNEFRIVGIMSPDMTGLLADDVSFWLPYEPAFPLIAAVPNPSQMMEGYSLQAVGRKSDGASAGSVVRELEARYGDGADGLTLQPGYRLDAIDGVVRNINVQRDMQRQLQLFLGASVLLALVAAANVSLFLLARAPGRRRELGIRMAVGAPLKRLARQLASESAVLVGVAAGLGLLVSYWLSQFLRGLAFLRQAEWSDVTLLDWRVLAFVGAFILALTLLVSLAPVLGLKRLGIAASSRQVAARATLAQHLAGTLQVAVAGGLGAAAIAFGWYLGSMVFGYPGYEIGNRYVVQYSTMGLRFMNFEEFQAMVESQVVELPRRREAIEAIPGVSAAAFGAPVPGMNLVSWTQVPDPNNPGEFMRLNRGTIDSRYVDVLGLRLLHGRTPDDSDREDALVNQALAREFWGREDVVGETIPLGANPTAPQAEVIGVLADLSFEHPAADVEPILFMTQIQTLATTAIIESTLSAAALQQALESAASPGDALAVRSVRPLRDLRNEIIAADRARGLLTIGTATLVVVLAAFGFYGTQRFLVAAGRREYAIRASLGAGPKALGRLVLARGILLSLPGLVAGALLAFMAVAWLRDDLVSRDISPGGVTVAVVAGLGLLLLLASLGPARQARRTKPAPLLKED